MTTALATIETDCIVHYYKSNGADYITRQQHGFNPVTGFFNSLSSEPTGLVECSLLKDRFNYSGPKEEPLSDLPREFWNQNLAASVFYSFCAGGGLLGPETMNSGDEVKLEGQRYQAFTPHWPKTVRLTLLKSLDTNRIERVKMEDPQQGLTWLLTGYNYRYSRELEKTLPRTIDVFDITDGTASKLLMIRFEYKDIREVNSQSPPVH